MAAFGVFIALEIYKDASEKEAAAEIKRSLHWMYTSRFYMTVQQKYLEFLVQHFVCRLSLFSKHKSMTSIRLLPAGPDRSLHHAFG